LCVIKLEQLDLPHITGQATGRLDCMCAFHSSGGQYTKDSPRVSRTVAAAECLSTGLDKNGQQGTHVHPVKSLSFFAEGLVK